MNYKTLSSKVMRVFDLADEQSRKFVRKTGLICPENCGECCRSKKVFATVLECIPASLYLWQIGKGDMVYDLLGSDTERTECIFYKENNDERRKGHCSIYPYRFLVCRLFSNSVQRDADGKSQLLTCKIIKQQSKIEFDKATSQLSEGLKAPIARDFAMRIYAIDPFRGKEFLPVNQAIKIALEITSKHPEMFSKAS
ncbi:MAG: YkgJ family cysteine cluster protein [Candidatus Cloacimonadales bacterium]|nr:YkgJ family cysteine cluster protein [Candidatus Cloacimonadales bacterium]